MSKRQWNRYAAFATLLFGVLAVVTDRASAGLLAGFFLWEWLESRC